MLEAVFLSANKMWNLILWKLIACYDTVADRSGVFLYCLMYVGSICYWWQGNRSDEPVNFIAFCNPKPAATKILSTPVSTCCALPHIHSSGFLDVFLWIFKDYYEPSLELSLRSTQNGFVLSWSLVCITRRVQLGKILKVVTVNVKGTVNLLAT